MGYNYFSDSKTHHHPHVIENINDCISIVMRINLFNVDVCFEMDVVAFELFYLYFPVLEK